MVIRISVGHPLCHHNNGFSHYYVVRKSVVKKGEHIVTDRKLIWLHSFFFIDYIKTWFKIFDISNIKKVGDGWRIYYGGLKSRNQRSKSYLYLNLNIELWYHSWSTPLILIKPIPSYGHVNTQLLILTRGEYISPKLWLNWNEWGYQWPKT